MPATELRKPSRWRRLVAFGVLGVVALAGCKVDLDVNVQSDDLGAGRIAVTAELDRDATAALVIVTPTTVAVPGSPASLVPSSSVAALQALPDAGTRLDLTDLRADGWDGPGLLPKADGSSSFELSHTFFSVDEANALLTSLSTTDGPLAGLRLKRNRSFIGTTITLSGPGDFTKGLAGFGDARIAAATNGGSFGVSDKEVLRQTGAKSLDDVLSVKVTSNLVDGKSSAVLPIGKASPINASGRSWAWATIASFAAALIGLALFFALRSTTTLADESGGDQ